MTRDEAELLLQQDVHVKFYLPPIQDASGLDDRSNWSMSPGFPGRWVISRYTLVECTDAGAVVTRRAWRYVGRSFLDKRAEEYSDTRTVPYSDIVGLANLQPTNA